MFIPSTTHCYENPVLSCDKRSTVHQRSFILSQPILRRLSSRFMRGNPDSNQNALRTENFPSYFGAISVLDRALLKANDAERSFFHMLDSDLDKISLFYNEKETEAKAKLEALKTQVRLIAEFGLQLSGAPINDKGHTPERKLNPLNWIRNRPCGKMDVECLPLSVKYDHQMSHRVARSRLKRHLQRFRKILKKFDKMAGWRASGLYMQKVKYYHWIISKDLDDIIRVTENSQMVTVEEP
ncbi:hypothetical protein BDF14DRAFT_1528645 [Spinellus fusiger]|nr:hypothetical protein BDF14DRAFT_1528645 [Spinellus fusiger]